MNKLLDETLLQQQIEEQRNLLSTDRLDLSFGEIMRMYQDGDIIIRPAFQRYFRWDVEQRTRFIESILLGIPIPPIFVAADGNGVWELVDGLQRVSTMLSFFGALKSKDEGIKSKNNWILGEGDKISALEGFTYETIPELFKRNLKRATCRVEILNWNSSYDMRFELFNRLNTGGSPLTPQEIRNCIYRDISDDFNQFLTRIASNEDFLSLIDLDDELIEQLYHEELALRFISLYKNTQIKHSIPQHMTAFMKQALENKEFDYINYEKVFTNVFALLNKLPLNRSIFRNQIKHQKDGQFATALYDVITIGIGENYDFYKETSPNVILDKINNEVKKDRVLEKFSRKGGNGQKDRIINRLREARRIFGSQNS
jgi:hypothetical protein